MTIARLAMAIVVLALAACAAQDDGTSARIKAGVDEATRQCEGLFADPALNVLRTRTDVVRPSGISFAMLTINEQERPAILHWAGVREKCTNLQRTAWSADAVYTRYFMPMDEALFVTTQTLLADLYRGETSWGQFNSARQTNASRLRETRARVAAELEAKRAEAEERARVTAQNAASMAILQMQQQQLQQQVWLQQMERSRPILCRRIGNTVFCS